MSLINPFKLQGFVHAKKVYDKKEGIKLLEFPEGFGIYTHTSKEETEFIYNEIFIKKVYLKEEFSFEQCKCVIDIGANIGLFGIFMSLKNRNTKVYALEPIDETYKIMVKNFDYHNLANVKTFNIAAGNEDNGSRIMHYYPFIAGHSTAHPEYHSQQRLDIEPIFGREKTDMIFSSKIKTVNVRTLASIIKENDIKTVDFLKIDTEGDELDVLNGILPDQYKMINQLCIETHSDDLLKEVKRFLIKRGYKIYLKEDILADNSQIVYAGR